MTNYETSERIKRDNIEKVDQYKYIGQTIALQCRTANETHIGIKAGMLMFENMKRYL